MSDMKTSTAAHRTIGLRAAWRRFLDPRRGSAGNVTIELAFLMTFLLTLVLGAYDFGRLALWQSTVTNSARAGAQYAVLAQANASDTSGIIQAARDEADDTEAELTITANTFCRCSGSSGTDSCTSNCADGQYAPRYVQVTVQDQLELMFDYPGIDAIQSLSSTSTMRVR
jgi:Flp pilus assembly protein TadG